MAEEKRVVEIELKFENAGENSSGGAQRRSQWNFRKMRWRSFNESLVGLERKPKFGDDDRLIIMVKLVNNKHDDISKEAWLVKLHALAERMDRISASNLKGNFLSGLQTGTNKDAVYFSYEDSKEVRALFGKTYLPTNTIKPIHFPIQSF